MAEIQQRSERHPMLSGTITIKKLLAAMRQYNASDLHIKVGLPPVYRIGGELKPIEAGAVTEEQADTLFDEILDTHQKQTLMKEGGLDFAWHLPDGDRFRIDLFKSGNHIHAACRRVKAEIPTYETLHLPPVYSTIVRETNEGLVLVVGVTGSGKSSTLAAMLDEVNRTRSANIITVEDPVEYRFYPKKSIVSQREIGIDVKDFGQALRYVVRQDPDVILIGEMRDAETMRAALQAAETGHLVFATLHCADAMGAFARMLEFFPESERDFIRSSLSMSLRAICAQRLLPATKGFEVDRVPATEVLLVNSTVRERIREGQEQDMPAIMASNTSDGMHLFTHSLAKLVEADWVDLRTALEYAPNREQLESLVRGVEVKSGALIGKIKSKR